ncbi:MAG: CvpA family protein [Chloroflexi bacterium]|nr:CvpA family protein [Chloroflexota bacterium]
MGDVQGIIDNVGSYLWLLDIIFPIILILFAITAWRIGLLGSLFAIGFVYVGMWIGAFAAKPFGNVFNKVLPDLNILGISFTSTIAYYLAYSIILIITLAIGIVVYKILQRHFNWSVPKALNIIGSLVLGVIVGAFIIGITISGISLIEAVKTEIMEHSMITHYFVSPISTGLAKIMPGIPEFLASMK